MNSPYRATHELASPFGNGGYKQEWMVTASNARHDETGPPMNLLARALLIIAMFGTACLGQTSDTSTKSAEMDPNDVTPGEWFPSWETAALAEAKRLHPELEEPAVTRVTIEPLGDRMRVETASGFCRLYGGLGMQGKWRANEVSSC